jgi:hypothetical protein
MTTTPGQIKFERAANDNFIAKLRDAQKTPNVILFDLLRPIGSRTFLFCQLNLAINAKKVNRLGKTFVE